tara:strand:- start:2666 stop:3115 length:450 start_codon:yes stop_codon:yes gene_type:complete
MNEYFDQISGYFEAVPIWPFALLGFICIVAGLVEILNRRRRANAIDNFRYTIETQLSGMYPKPINWPQNINEFLCARLPEMEQNFKMLRGFIPQKRLRSYNIDWNNYCHFCHNITDEKCIVEQSSENEQNPKVVFHKLVSKLLEHTKIA